MIEPTVDMVCAARKAIAAATRAGADPAAAAATAVLGVLSATFAVVASGRRQYLRSLDDDKRFISEVLLLRLEISTLDSVRRVIDGELGPLYNWLPSHLWTKDMLARLYGAAPAATEESQVTEIEDDCPHCSPTHGDPNAVPWGVRVHSDRDGDGQPTMLAVAKSDGAHVAESDAEWLRHLLRDHDEYRALLTRAKTILRDFADDDECHFNHHGKCEAHGTIRGLCRNALIKDLLSDIGPAGSTDGDPT